MDNHSAHVGQGDDANLRLVRFFSICLGSLVFVYALFSVRLFVDAGHFGVTDDLLIALRVLLGATALVVISYPAWLAQRLEPVISEMGRLFEGECAVPRMNSQKPAGDGQIFLRQCDEARDCRLHAARSALRQRGAR